MKSILILAVLAGLMGCDSDSEKRDAMRLEREQFDLDAYKKSVNNCVDNGGTVIRSPWDNRILGCDYPNDRREFKR